MDEIGQALMSLGLHYFFRRSIRLDELSGYFLLINDPKWIVWKHRPRVRDSVYVK